MLLHLAKSKQPLLVFFITLCFILLWLQTIINPITLPTLTEAMPFYKFLAKFALNNYYSGQILILSVTILVGFMLNSLNTKFIFIAERTYLPVIFFLIIVSGTKLLQTFNPSIFAAVFIILAIERLMDAYKNEQLSFNSLDSSFLISIASLFYMPALFLIVIIWAALLIFRPFYWREWLYTIIGLASPYVILSSIYYLLDLPKIEIFQPIISCLNGTKILPSMSFGAFLFYIWVAFLVIISSQNMIKLFPTKKVFARKAFNLFLILFLLSVAIFITIPKSQYEMIIIAAIPATFLISHFFLNIKKNWWGELLFDVIVLLAILCQFID